MPPVFLSTICRAAELVSFLIAVSWFWAIDFTGARGEVFYNQAAHFGVFIVTCIYLHLKATHFETNQFGKEEKGASVTKKE